MNILMQQRSQEGLQLSTPITNMVYREESKRVVVREDTAERVRVQSQADKAEKGRVTVQSWTSRKTVQVRWKVVFFALLWNIWHCGSC